MPRLATLISALVLTLPGTALAQGAGDDQYQDPFAEETGQQQDAGTPRAVAQQQDEDGGLSESPDVGGSGDSGSGSSGSDSGSAGQSGSTATTPAPTTTQPEAAAQGEQLPNTGSDPRLLLLFGLAFLMIGVGLRLRTIDPDAY